MRIFSSFVAILTTVCCCESSEVVCTFSHGDSCIVECDGIKKEFANFQQLSDGINAITNKYFTVDSIHRGSAEGKPNFTCDSIIFKNFTNKKAEEYLLEINGTDHYAPNLEIDCANNTAKLPRIKLDNIEWFSIKSLLKNPTSLFCLSSSS